MRAPQAWIRQQVGRCGSGAGPGGSGRCPRGSSIVTSIPVWLLAASAASIIFLLLATASSHAESPRSLVRKGNRSLEKGEIEKAIEYYERASVDAPESPVVAIDRGLAYLENLAGVHEGNLAGDLTYKTHLMRDDDHSTVLLG